MNAKDPQPLAGIEQPQPSPRQQEVWGSDAMAAMLRALDVPYLALNPGASYRGLHDSLVNYLGNERPQMLLCIHEEVAVAIAHGYARAADRMMGAVVHSNVGLMHATMAIFNAWCDRVPILLLGATGPWDAARRRPWIDWIHTASDQGALVRDYTKWDNQPASVPAAYEALLRGAQLANTAPRGPVYINLDAAVQEDRLAELPAVPDPARFAPAPAPEPPRALVAQAAGLLSSAKAPLILAGRCSRSLEGWRARVALAEKLQARVATDLKLAAAFPTDHPLHVGPPGVFLGAAPAAALREADVILALDWNDLAGTLKQAYAGAPVRAKVINVSCDMHLHRGWSMDYQGLPPTDIALLTEPDVAVPILLEACSARERRASPPGAPAALPAPTDVSLLAVANALEAAARGMELCIAKLPLGWNGAYRHFRHPLDYLGGDGGGGVGAGPGLVVGAALALQGTGRLAVGIVGDGDFLMANTAIWTAVHYRLPALFIVCNNRSFYNDEVHQERVAKERGRPVENKWIGQKMIDPEIDIAAIARAQGAEGIGPVAKLDEVQPAIERGLALARDGKVVVIDARVLPGYDANLSGAVPTAHKR
ncbi:MAG TPA: thiamine pyrophosphate-dependent enzyme [Burkholderiales bacterium]|nr:thiamine pyrophosphate-dependent enzyme [Burkholderiales bacterium]